MKMWSTTMLLLCATAAVPAENAGAAAAAGVERQGPLAALPSAPGAHLAKIKALKDGEWINLGSPAADPKWGKARGRTWSCKMPYAPEFQGAFLIGKGIHGYVMPNGRLMDDIWFYDLNAHGWICLYPGTNTTQFVENIKKGALKVDEMGRLVDQDGLLVPFSTISGHSYQYHTYDTDRHKYIFAAGHPGIGHDQHFRNQEWYKQGLSLLYQQGKTDRVKTAPYCFDTVSGKFERSPPAQPFPSSSSPVGAVNFYLPTRKMLFYYQNGKTCLSDPVTNKCEDAGAKGPAPPGSSDLGACYDSKRDCLYLGRGAYGKPAQGNEGNVFIYDVKTNAWSNPPNKPKAGAFPGNNSGFVHYDTANDRVLSFYLWNKQGSASIYNPEKHEWEEVVPIPGDLAQFVTGASHGFYSPEVNAHFLYIAGDSDDRGTMWVYRYKSAKK